VFLPILDPYIAAQKHSQLQNAIILSAWIEGRWKRRPFEIASLTLWMGFTY
jgi:hypothetical protein